MDDMVKVTLSGSHCGATERQRGTLLGLGLTRRGKTVILKNSPCIQGMLIKVAHLVKVEE
ncbi:MAG: large subunit ribosomal protein L30 [Hyphomicrobiaceae bacterium]|jgi:large subunit ribosomal protein L30